MSRIKSAVSAAKTRSRLAAELVAMRARRAAYLAIAAEVEALPLPEPRFVGDVGTRQTEWAMGDVSVWSFDGLSAERRNALASSWRAARIRERGAPSQVYAHQLEDLERRLAKIDAKIASLTGPA